MIERNSTLPTFTHNDSTTFVNESLLRIEITEYIQAVNFWITIIEIIMVICGLLGNGLALIVINHRSLRDTSSSVFITYLAIFDISVLIVHITNLASLHWIQSYIFHCFLAYLTDLVTFCSVWIMVIMTIERCIAVRSPFLAKRFCTIEHARHSISILLLFALILFSSTFPLFYTIDKEQQKCGVRYQYQMILRVFKPTIFYFVPDLLLLANVFVIYELFMARKQRTKTLMNPENAVQQLNAVSFNRKQQQLTLMLVTVSLSFYLFTTPAIIDYIRQINPPTDYDLKKLKMRFLTANLTVLWLQMSSATNFLFYCLAGSRFRAATVNIIRDCYDYIQAKITNDDDYIHRRRYRQSKSEIQLSLHLSKDLRNGINKTRSNPNIKQLNNLSKHPSSETVISAQLNSRRASNYDINDQQV